MREHQLKGGLNRVLLLTDGLANVGETNADNIATDVKRLSVEGVGTTTMGVGDDDPELSDCHIVCVAYADRHGHDSDGDDRR